MSGVRGTPVDWSGELAVDGGWALLADGMGGHVAGDVAASLAIEVMRPMMPELRTDMDITDAVNCADEAIFMAMQMRPELHGMGTTIAGVLLRPAAAMAFNAGDSRVYSFENGNLSQVSVDDVTRNGHLLQCLGGYAEPVRMFVHVRRIYAGASILICSDGLTDMVTDSDIAAILSNCPVDPAAALVDAALAGGGHDNVSVIFIEASK